ncbi:hypothetical protein CL684_00490 [Candidatus Campbellbacteria bacterium]|mgnify:CR=1 FL=1|nr:hypothetical protein [Candidatus Campbellbacteria bacterium]|tara:strand:+ start:243 stop:1331 length:1089 start_codon:yes stop_codon:yes gene_type:complete
MRKLLIIICLLFSSIGVYAQEAANSQPEEIYTTSYVSGTVIEKEINENGFVNYRTRLRDGRIIDVDTYGEVIEEGDSIYLEHLEDLGEYNFITVNRSTSVILLLILFVGSIIVLAKKKGLRSLGSLIISMALLFFGLVPLLLSGVDPVLVTILFGLGVLFVSIFVTHGFNYQSLVSFLGSFGSVLLAIVLIALVSEYSSLTGLINDEIQFLSFESEKVLNLTRIISASIIIGVLGVLDDITITQVAVVRELSSDTTLTRSHIFTKALRVGRDHISSLVNTLVFAYVGATLPMIMFITLLDIPFYILISQEFIFIEIIRSLIGAIALTLAVPLTTWLATHVFLGHIHRDACTLDSACAHHHHH